MLNPSVTPHYSLVAIYTSHLLASIFTFYIWLVSDTAASIVTSSPWRASLLLELGHPALCLLAFSILLSLPVRETSAPPQRNAEGQNPALDDWATLGQWLSFSWLDALIARPVYYELANLALDEQPGPGGRTGLWSDGAFFALEPKNP